MHYNFFNENFLSNLKIEYRYVLLILFLLKLVSENKLYKNDLY